VRKANPENLDGKARQFGWGHRLLPAPVGQIESVRLNCHRQFKERGQVERPILVDDLLGTGHKMYGALPNMTYIIGRSGRVLFRSDWTDPSTIELVLNYLLNVRARRRAGDRLAAFYAEFMGYRNVDPVKFQQGLEVAGPQAVEDFARTMQRWTSQGKTPSRLEG